MVERLVSRLLRGVHAGERRLAWNDPAVAGAPASIGLASPAFAARGAIPPRHAGKHAGDNVSPPLVWSDVPAEAAELALIVEDPDAPIPRPFVHLIAVGIDPRGAGLEEGALSGGVRPDGIRLGRNSFGRAAYDGPRPLRGHGPHRYVFQLFAVARTLDLPERTSKAALLRSLAGAVCARGRLEGIVERR